MPVFVAIGVHPRPDHTRRVAADHLDGVTRVLRVYELPGVAAAPRRHAAVLFCRSSSLFDPSDGRRCRRRVHGRGRHWAAAGETGCSRLPCRAPSPAGALHNPALNHHRFSVHSRRQNGRIFQNLVSQSLGDYENISNSNISHETNSSCNGPRKSVAKPFPVSVLAEITQALQRPTATQRRRQQKCRAVKHGRQAGVSTARAAISRRAAGIPGTTIAAARRRRTAGSPIRRVSLSPC